MMPGHLLIQELSRRIDEVLSALIPARARCALLDYPRYGNLGDCAIWLGEICWLRRRGVELVHTGALHSAAARTLARRLGDDGIILLSGGGNFGDLYPAHQREREALIAAFPRQRLIQLPQSLWFDRDEPRDRARAVLSSHRRLTILCRDRQSMDCARSLGVPAALCPDLALALGPLPRGPAPDLETLWLWRTGAEAYGRAPIVGPGSAVCDWSAIDRRILARTRNALDRIAAAGLGGVMAAIDHGVAARRVRAGCRLLSRARVVVTNRLHAHVLSLLMGIPHVVLDNSYGKIRRFYDAWIRPSPLVQWADTPAEAWALVSRERSAAG